MSTFIAPPLDFDVLKEIWNKYELADNAVVKVKIVLTGVSKTQQEKKTKTAAPAPPKYSLDFKNVVVVLSNERGKPDTKVYSPKELQASVIKDDMRFSTTTQDWNEYVVDDGTRIKVQPMIMKVVKTSKFNTRGVPVYWTDIQLTMQIKTPKSLSP